MNKNKITDIFGFLPSQEMTLEYIEQLFLQVIEQKKEYYKIPDSDKVLYIGTPPDKLLNDLQKGAITELKSENKNIGYIMKNDMLVVIAAYII